MKNNRRPEREPRAAGELSGRRILLGVTGGIAAYKAVELARLLMQSGAKVQVIMTAAATKFVVPLTFETVTGRSVFVEMFPDHGKESPWHTELSSWAELIVVAPATADHIGRIACGLGDDLLTTTLLAYERRRVICPSMNPRMWANPAVQENLNTLRRRGFRVINPEEGEMARPGEDPGLGRLAEPETIYAELRHLLSAPQDLRGVRVLVTAGRTEESWDPVRVLTNRASGRMGFALAEEARERGADVSLVAGPTDVTPPTGVRLTRITTARQMAEAVKRDFHQCNILLMSAAVSDYTFENTAQNKIKKGDPDPEIHLVPTEDILRGISQNKGSRVIVGFALETENVLDNALRKLREKHLDIVVANNPLAKGSGFQVETNQVFIIHRSGNVQDLPLQSKREIAREILNAVMEIYRNPLPEPDVEPELDLDIEPELDDEIIEDTHGLVRFEGLDLEDAADERQKSQPKSGKGQGKQKPKEQHKQPKPQPKAQAKPQPPQQQKPQQPTKPQPQQQPKPQPRPQSKPEPVELKNGHTPPAPVVTPPQVQPATPPTAAQIAAGQAAKKKSRRGGRRERLRRERQAQRAANQSGMPFVNDAPVVTHAAPVEAVAKPQGAMAEQQPAKAAKKSRGRDKPKAEPKPVESVAAAPVVEKPEAPKKAAKKKAEKTPAEAKAAKPKAPKKAVKKSAKKPTETEPVA